ncbi:MAG TPA: transglycosylase domain-containing protein [Gemmatimonadales bacterium]|nr:transglycosylase domain-containing protein [Gemmatimonadales bacterium]
MQDSAPIPLKPPRTRRRRRAQDPTPAGSNGGDPNGPVTPAKPKVKKLRLALVLLGLGALALISTVFGMMMAVAHELPQLEAQAQLRSAVNSTLLSSGGQQIAKLTGNENRIVNTDAEISPNIKNAVIAIEDRRFYEHEGVDLRGMSRALWSDITAGGAVQGASTITQQFVKNALTAQNDRTVFEKLREAALAYHLEHKWSKTKILDNYLNTIYFGNGAYGVESAVRTYFGGKNRQYAQNERIAKDVTPAQAAMIAAMIASPSAYDPIQNPIAARERRDLVLHNMLDQGLITQTEYSTAIEEAIPARQDLITPHADSTQPYFSSWVTQQLVDRYGAGSVFGGGMKVTSSIDVTLQHAAEQAIAGRLGGIGPSASLVAIENKTGEVKAMVGGTDFEHTPFNLATNGHRQPGSAMKPFILATALQHGISPTSLWSSRQKIFPVPNSKHEKFVVNNFEGEYAGTTTLANALVHSDNSVFAEVGLKLGTKKVAAEAERMGIRTPISTNPAMVLGGLKEGVTPLEMAYAYSTIANRGKRVSGSFAASPLGPVAYTRVQRGGDVDKNKVKTKRVFPESVGEQMREIMHGVVLYGTGVEANVTDYAAGKTGTTENYGDAWFVGFTDKYTVAVWVGYPDKLKYMKTEFHGGPVAGGTFPAQIWHDFMTSAIAIDHERHPDKETDTSETTTPSVGVPTPAAPAAPATTAPAEPAAPAPSTGGGPPQQPAPAPPPQQPATPPQQQPTPPSGGGGDTSGGGGGGAGGGTPPGGTGRVGGGNGTG